MSEMGSYVEMKMDHHLPVNKGKGSDCRRAAIVTGDHCSVAACGMEGWELEEEGGQGQGYMTMSPQVSHSLSVLPQDDYVTMASPHKHNWPSYFPPSTSLKTSFNRLV